MIKKILIYKFIFRNLFFIQKIKNTAATKLNKESPVIPSTISKSIPQKIAQTRGILKLEEEKVNNKININKKFGLTRRPLKKLLQIVCENIRKIININLLTFYY